MKRAEIVLEARSWLGTPFQHQARLKGVAVDCAGLVAGIAKAFGLPVIDRTDYSRLPDGFGLLEACEENLTRIPVISIQPGDVVVFRYEKDPQHLALIGDYPGGGLSLIHALNTVGRVVETSLRPVERRRIVAAYQYPGVEA